MALFLWLKVLYYLYFGAFHPISNVFTSLAYVSVTSQRADLQKCTIWHSLSEKCNEQKEKRTDFSHFWGVHRQVKHIYYSLRTLVNWFLHHTGPFRLKYRWTLVMLERETSRRLGKKKNWWLDGFQREVNLFALWRSAVVTRPALLPAQSASQRRKRRLELMDYSRARKSGASLPLFPDHKYSSVFDKDASRCPAVTPPAELNHWPWTDESLR